MYTQAKKKNPGLHQIKKKQKKKKKTKQKNKQTLYTLQTFFAWAPDRLPPNTVKS
jgi:hypothetical protein